jgi:hypothetical protein
MDITTSSSQAEQRLPSCGAAVRFSLRVPG